MTKLLLLSIFSLTVIKTNVFACDCDGTPSFETELKGSDKIFVGQVVSIKPYKAQKGQNLFNEFVIEFKIEKVYRGTIGKYVKVRTAVAVASCGYPFEKNKTYLVYSFVNSNAFHVTYCSRTKLLDQAKEDIDKLNKISVTEKTATNAAFHNKSPQSPHAIKKTKLGLVENNVHAVIKGLKFYRFPFSKISNLNFCLFISDFAVEISFLNL